MARRAGDLPSFYANSERAHALLGWPANLGLGNMCRDTWTWQSQNLGGYTRSAENPFYRNKSIHNHKAS